MLNRQLGSQRREPSGGDALAVQRSAPILYTLQRMVASYAGCASAADRV
jgi:hypothetical protein